MLSMDDYKDNNDHLAVRCKSGGGEFPSHIAMLPFILKSQYHFIFHENQHFFRSS